MEDKWELKKIGQVRREDGIIYLEILPDYHSALLELDHFSHLIVFGWIEQEVFPGYREVLTTRPPYAQEHLSGVFATRSPFRPNPILCTVCKIETIDYTTGIVQIQDIDMFDETPIIDIKAYFPVTDRVRQAEIPAWLSGWPAWFPEEGSRLMPHVRSAAFNPRSKSQAGCGRLLVDWYARFGKAVLLSLKALLYLSDRYDPPVALA